MLGTSDAWSMSRSSHQPSDQAYYIEDCRISTLQTDVLATSVLLHTLKTDCLKSYKFTVFFCFQWTVVNHYILTDLIYHYRKQAMMLSVPTTSNHVNKTMDLCQYTVNT